MREIILLGGGGHCKPVIEAILLQNKYKVVGIFDPKKRIGDRILDIPVIGDDNAIRGYFEKGIKNCFITVGSIGNPDLRIKLFNKAKKIGFRFPNVIHPDSIISKFVKLGEGNYIACGVVIIAGASLGDNCIVNSGAVIEHDCNIDDFVHIASGATICGGVTIGKYSHIGAGASVIQYIKIGQNSIIGIGSVVVEDIEDGIIAYGNLCRKIKNNDR